MSTTVRNQVRKILAKSLSIISYDELTINLAGDTVTNQFNDCYNELCDFFAHLPSSNAATGHSNSEQENNEALMRKEAIQELVSQIFLQQHGKKQLLLLRIISKLVMNRVVEVRFVCEFLIAHLVYSSNGKASSSSSSSSSATGLPVLTTSNANNSNSNNVPSNINNLNNPNTPGNPGSVVHANSAVSSANSTNGAKATPPFIWCKVIECIIRFIPHQDYKTCRDIFKMLLEVVKRIPHANSSYPVHYENDGSSAPTTLLKSSDRRRKASQEDIKPANMSTTAVASDIMLDSLYQAISFLLDPANYFMPRYLAINEIKLVLSFGKEPYHQRFHSLVTDFVNSFVPTANLISISGREKFLPVVGFSNLYSLYSFWRFNPSTCKFNTSGPLPYYKHASKPHQDVYYYMLRQNTPQYLLITLMSLHRSNKSRYPIFEEEFAGTIVDTMRLCEDNPSVQDNLRLWNNLVNQFIAMNQIMSLTSLISQITVKLRKSNETLKNSRDWLMWFLLLTISSLANRNCTIEFSELFDILYRDEEPLAAPDQTQFVSVIKMAPLAIWIFLNIRPSQDQSNSSAGSGSTASSRNSALNKPLKVPDVLRNHLTLLQDCMQNYSSPDFALSICMNAYSIDSATFSPLLNSLFEKIGKVGLTPQQHPPSNTNHAPSPSLVNFQPLSLEMISSFSLHTKMHILNYVTYFLAQKQNMGKQLVFNIPAAIPETFARMLITDPENFIKYFSQNHWQVLNPPNIQLQSTTLSVQTQSVFVHQQLNLAIELIAYRFKHLSFTHRSTMLFHLNCLFTGQPGQQMAAQSNNPNQQQQQQSRPDQISYIKHPQIYINAHCAFLKMLSSFSGSDYYEFLNSVYTASKHSPKYYINPESEEINKAIVLVLARAINLTSSDLHPQYENKDKDDAIRATLKQIYEMTPMYFPDYVLEYFPKVMQQFILAEQSKKPNERVTNERMLIDSSNKQYKLWLKKRVDDDYQRFFECRHETQAQTIFQSQSVYNTLLCVFFKLLQGDPNMNMNQYLQFIHSNLNGLENKKLTQSLRTLCDFLIIEATNASKETLQNYVNQISQMINTYNVFTYDRFLMIMTFRSFDATDFQLALRILNLLFVQNSDFDAKLKYGISLWNSYCNDKEDWNINFYSQYMNQHPEKFMYEGIKDQIGIQPTESIINTYYGNLLLRCVPVLDFLNNRYIEIKEQSSDMDNLLDYLNSLYVFNSNQMSYVYNSLAYYNHKFESTSINESGLEVYDNSKKKRLLQILLANSWKMSPGFTNVFLKHASSLVKNRDNEMMIASDNGGDIRSEINDAYYYNLLKRLQHSNKEIEFDVNRSEFLNPSCHLVYITICELECLELFVTGGANIDFSRNICVSILQLFFKKDNQIDKKELPYWINMAGMIIANLPEPYWHSIYDFLRTAIQRNELLAAQDPKNAKEALFNLLDHFDLTLATEKNCCDETTILVTLFNAIHTHANANHFLYFVKYLKENMIEEINTEQKFLFVCKLVGPFLSKIHIENTNLLLELVNNLYDMILTVSQSNENLYYLDTICNFFYHLKYRHIGESIKEKIFNIMPSIRPELQKLLKYVTSDFSHLQQQLQGQQQQPSSVQSQRSV